VQVYVNIKKTFFAGFIISFFLPILCYSNNPIILNNTEIGAIHNVQQYNPNLVPHGKIEINYDTNFTDYGFAGSGTAEDPFIISNLNISLSNTGRGIAIRHTTKFFVIENCFIDTQDDCIFLFNITESTAIVRSNHLYNSNSFGVRLIDSSNLAVLNNTIINHYQSGISLNVCPYTLIENNLVVGTGLGTGGACIAIESSAFTSLINNSCIVGATDGIYMTNSPNSLIKNNYCLDNRHFGIWLYDYCSDSLIFNNTLVGSITGINVWEDYSTKIYNNTCLENDYGLNIYKSNFIQVKHNVLDSNYKNGITLGVSSISCEIIFNNITENYLYGATVEESSEYNLFHHNNFIDNNILGSSQALDDGKKTMWYDEDSKQGNYWNDREKRIYKIDGISNSEDPYPLKEPVDNTTIIRETNSLHLWIIFVSIIVITTIWRKKRQIF
jgi:parallel beta-helix repeat protein